MAPELPLPTPPEREQPSTEQTSRSEGEEDVVDPDYNFKVAAKEGNPYYPNQKDFKGLLRDLDLTKSKAKLLMSRLKQWNLLDEGMQIANHRKRNLGFSSFLTHQNGLCFCHNVTNLCEAIGIACNPNKRRLFIDSSSRSLRAVLSPDSHGAPQDFAGCLKYDEYSWESSEISKWDGGISGASPRHFTKFLCYLCLWECRDNAAHHHRQDWPQWTEFSVRMNNVKWEPLMKQFVTALDKESAAFKYLQDFFLTLSEAKVKAGMFVRPQIKKILESMEFPKKLTRKELGTALLQRFGVPGNHKAENYVELVETMMKN
ncbi:uncharacterized protein [Panulirus ornatus]|uniref:uncharacterized protein n=1 Tax=Panulirus ornatus TaxID=150431 RepID=UPI003A8A4DE5